MAKGENLDYNVKIGIDSKQFRAEITKCNKETREFKRQQKEAFKQAGESAESGFGKAIAAAKKLAPAIGLGATALKVAQTAMQEHQRITDEWGRITESARASYENFVHTLISGDFSGYLSNMKAVVQAAREAYDALDAVGTASIFYNKSMAESELAIRQARYTIKAPESTAEERKAAGEVLQREQNKQIAESQRMADIYMKGYAAKLAELWTASGVNTSIEDLVTTNESGRVVAKAGSLYEKYYKDLETYNRWAAIYAEEKAARGFFWNGDKWLKGEGPLIGKGKGNMADDAFFELEAIIEASDDKLKESFGLLQNAWQTEIMVLTKSIENFEYLRNANKPITAGGAGSSTKVYAEGSISYINQQLAEARTQFEVATTDAAREVARKLVMELENELDRAQTFRRASGIESIGNLPGLQATGLKPLTLDPNVIRRAQGQPATDTSKDLANASEIAINGIELVTDTMRQLGITSEIADEGLRKTLSVLGNALAIVGNSIGGVWGKGLTALGGIIGSFEGGGIVGGTSYTGDHLTAKVNSKEMWLSTSQQSRLLSMINGSGGAGGGSYNAMLTGENLYFALRNYGRRTGKIYLP